MEKVNTLDILLQIEAKAAAMVDEAQREADRRIHESEEKNHAAYDERFKAEVQRLEAGFQREKEEIKKKYQNTLDEYCREISSVNVNTERFCALLNEYLAAQE